jgi:hypothetical protein
MFSDNKSLSDQSKAQVDESALHKGKENISQLTEALESEEPQVEYASLGWDTDAQFDKDANVIMVAQEYEELSEQEPALVEPLLAHERVHAEHQGSEPTDEASLQSYMDEELEAYQAEYEAWQAVKDHYTAPEIRSSLDPAGRELVARYESKFEDVERTGWEDFRIKREQVYRKRMVEGS